MERPIDYFRSLYAQHPQLLDAPNSEEALAQWRRDHSDSSDVPKAVKAAATRVRTSIRGKRPDATWGEKLKGGFQDLSWWIAEGVKAVPALRYLQGLMAVMAAIGIVLFYFKLPAETAVFGTVFFIILATGLIVFSEMAKAGDEPKSLPARVLYYVIVTVIALSIIFLFTWGFFEFPSALNRFFLKSTPLVAQPVSAPDEFHFTPCLTADDRNLPDELFGPTDDDIGMHRQWMRIMDGGASKKLKVVATDSAMPFWLLTDAFGGLHHGFDAHVYAGTPDKVIICAFLVQPNSSPTDKNTRLISLKRKESSIPGLYRFEVPVSQEGNRLVVFLTLRKSSYDAILPVKKFRIRSKSLS